MNIFLERRRRAFSRINPRTFPSHLHRAQMIRTSLQGFNAEEVKQADIKEAYATGALVIQVLLPLRI